MRAFKKSLPLTVESLLQRMALNRMYTEHAVRLRLGCSREGVRDLLQRAVADGAIREAAPDKNGRVYFWREEERHVDVATRRWGAAIMTGQLEGYTASLDRFRSLCERARRR
ncbi:hypothetical protein [Paraburkholderia caballeronis]|uniref:Uncharacterized protein n=1 Tax=Paraburkholderia caballeronis TaxID=416943 RepID=A0A1H7L118_9BURK|nr:hypothetical protein [Paraburkholderia caballeronis]PXW28243.1 hypothetical protein C7403_102135 [Paraburkholderia caballeronis]PXX03609.1 hypothetical protein C7407_102135 [Paraburkholderia caballeronis]RAK04353.1 hypothetical protein C7409_102135 [Paraburkholderia caballeronis]SED83609.1 hypothetical protein SAMN05445871_4044 [Paraburkholderia caballeronis]SEK92534.1 hypothetical protein SAMN05192542_104135 [Paraburkholderia caballeronis]